MKFMLNLIKNHKSQNNYQIHWDGIAPFLSQRSKNVKHSLTLTSTSIEDAIPNKLAYYNEKTNGFFFSDFFIIFLKQNPNRFTNSTFFLAYNLFITFHLFINTFLENPLCSHRFTHSHSQSKANKNIICFHKAICLFHNL